MGQTSKRVYDEVAAAIRKMKDMVIADPGTRHLLPAVVVMQKEISRSFQDNNNLFRADLFATNCEPLFKPGKMGKEEPPKTAPSSEPSCLRELTEREGYSQGVIQSLPQNTEADQSVRLSGTATGRHSGAEQQVAATPAHAATPSRSFDPFNSGLPTDRRKPSRAGLYGVNRRNSNSK